MPDDKLTPRFQPVREIARGGMGRVVEAYDVELRRTVALKQALDGHPDARRRFEREIEITARLEHPSIVPLYDAGHGDDGTPFYVMRKLAGTSLEDVVRAAPTLDARLVVLPNLLAVADAVAHAHGRGVIHRDLKPSNVLVGDFGETVVIDWGLAKLIGEPDDPARADVAPAAAPLTAAGAVVGTPGFMAPEQVAGAPVDARADVYALGACLQYVLTGVPPHVGTARDLAGVPRDLVTIVDTAMARDPAARYLDAGGFSEDLRRFLAGQLVASHHYTWQQRTARWLRRHRRAVIAGTIVAAAAIALGAVSLREIVAARGRAEAALASERDRADDLIVVQASGYLDDDPTLAVATLQQLPAESTRWDRAADLLVEARGRGIAVGYPGHGDGMTHLDLSPDGTRLVTAGTGAVWLDDLVHHTATRLYTGSGIVRALWCGELVMITDLAGTSLVDPRTGAREPLAGEHRSVHRAGDQAIVVDAAGAVTAIDASHGLPLPAPVVVARGPSDGAIGSRSGRWMVVTGGGETRLVDRTRRDVVATLPGEALLPAFDEGEHRVAIALEQSIVAIDLDTLARETWKTAAVAIGFAGDELLAFSRGEVLALVAGGGTAERGRYEALGGAAFGSRGPWGFVLEAPRRIAIANGSTVLELRPPHDIAQIAVRGRYLVGASAAAVLAWDLDELLPERAAVPTAERLSFLDATTLAALGDLRDGPTLFAYPAGEAPVPLLAHVALGAATALGDGALTFEAPGQPDLVLFDHRARVAIPELAAATVYDHATLVIGTTDGRLARFDRATHETAPLAVLPAVVDTIAVDGGWTLAQARDGTAVRLDPTGGETRLATHALALAIDRDGTAYLAEGARLLAWRLAPPLPIATLAQPIAAVHPLVGGRLAVETADHALAILDAATGERRDVQPASLELAFAGDASTAVARYADRVVVIDLRSGESVPIAMRFATLRGGVALSPDGTTLVVGARDGGRDAILRFSLRPPPVPFAWVRDATNALPPHGARGALEWRSLVAR